MKKILLIILLISLSTQAEENKNFFYLMLNKCVSNEIDFSKSKDFKVLAADNITIICSKNENSDRISCKIMNTESGKVLVEKDFVIEMSLPELSKLRAKDYEDQVIVINKSKKGAMYFHKELQATDKIKQLVCSGTYNNQEDLKNLIKEPKEVKENKNLKKGKNKLTIESYPALIGE